MIVDHFFVIDNRSKKLNTATLNMRKLLYKKILIDFDWHIFQQNS
jgi:hypothetical protein